MIGSILRAELNAPQEQLLKEAEKAMRNSYAPYNKKSVGAAVRTEDGKFFLGATLENASYGVSVDAELIAIGAANTAGARRYEAIAIISDQKDIESPCGGCRQAISEASEIAGNDLEIICASTQNDRVFVTTVSKFLPDAFGPIALGVDASKYRK